MENNELYENLCTAHEQYTYTYQRFVEEDIKYMDLQSKIKEANLSGSRSLCTSLRRELNRRSEVRDHLAEEAKLKMELWFKLRQLLWAQEAQENNSSAVRFSNAE